MHLGHGKAVERAGHGQRVGAHVLVDEPVPEAERRQQDVGVHLVQAVARWAPHGRRGQLAGRRLKRGRQTTVMLETSLV